MTIKLKHKLLLLIFVPLSLAFVMVAVIYNNHLQSYFQKMALQDTTHRLEVFESKMQNLQASLNSYAKSLQNDPEIINSLNLIINYQDPDSYRYLIFDSEKKKLLENSKSLSVDGYSFEVSYFNAQKELLAHGRYGHDSRRITQSFNSSGEVIYLDQNSQVTQPDAVFLDRLSEETRYGYYQDALHLQQLTPLFKDNEVFGYIKLGVIIDEKNFQNLVEGINDSLYLVGPGFMLSKNGKKVQDLSYEDLVQASRGYVDASEYIYNFIKLCEDFNGGNLFAVSSLSKKDLHAGLDTLFYQVTSVLALSFLALTLLVTAFTNRFFMMPLNSLVASIKELKQKRYKAISVDSNDELGEIAKEFNELSLQLQQSIVELERSNTQLEEIFNAVPLRIFIKDMQGRYIKANSYFLQDCGFAREEELIGKTDQELPWSKEQNRIFQEDDRKVLFENEKLMKKQEFLRRHDGSDRVIMTSKIALKNSSAQPEALLGVYDDVTEQKSVERQLEEKERYLMHQSRLAQMGEMISMIAHQWRQPLAAISSTANAMSLKLAMGRMDKEYFAAKLDNINEYSQHLSSTIDDFRNFFKKHKDKKKVTMEQMVDDSINIIATSMQNRSIRLYKEYDCHKYFYTYPNEVRQVILNLLKNAEDVLVERTDMEHKWVKIATAYQNSRYVLTIEDNAGGIDDTIIDKIFEPYFSTKQNKDGTGLGLYMSKTIIEEHCGGVLSVYNGKDGAVFKVEI